MSPEFDPVVAGVVFLASFTDEFLGTLYLKKAAERKANQAAVISGAMFVLGCIGLYAFVNNPLYLVPEGIAVTSASYLAVKYG